jgi:Ca-activated chloride channel family protein
LDLKPNGNYSRTFIILTDGEVTCESEAFKLVRDNLAEANLFAIGIGSSINDYIIKGLAYSGMGEPYFIESQAEANEVGEKFIKTVSNPVLTNIEIISEDVEIYDIEPKNVPDVFSNRPIIIYGKYKNSNIGNITIKGISGNENYEQKFYLLDNKSEKNIALKYLWARNRIKYLADYEDYYNELTNVEKITEVTEIGLKYGLLTKYTSFIAIDSLVRESQGCIENTESGLEQGLADNETFNNTNTGSVRFTIPNVVDTLTTYDMELATVDYLSDAAYLSQTETFSEEVEVFGTEEEVIIEQVFECFQISEQPAFAGGDVALQQYISENLQYPKDAWENDIQGTVYIRFEVKASGEIGQIQVLRSVDPSLDAEAVRIIKSLPKFSPGKQNGYTVSVWFVIPIKFNLE